MPHPEGLVREHCEVRFSGGRDFGPDLLRTTVVATGL